MKRCLRPFCGGQIFMLPDPMDTALSIRVCSLCAYGEPTRGEAPVEIPRDRLPLEGTCINGHDRAKFGYYRVEMSGRVVRACDKCPQGARGQGWQRRTA